MSAFEFPDSYAEVRFLSPLFAFAVLMALPIVLYRNIRFTGVAPKGKREWWCTVDRLLAVVAVLFSALGGLYNAAIAMATGFAGALLLLALEPKASYLRVLASVSILCPVLYALFPTICNR